MRVDRNAVGWLVVSAGPMAEDSDTFSGRETTREGKEKSKEAKNVR